jgi:hypothetical protein
LLDGYFSKARLRVEDCKTILQATNLSSDLDHLGIRRLLMIQFDNRVTTAIYKRSTNVLFVHYHHTLLHLFQNIIDHFQFVHMSNEILTFDIIKPPAKEEKTRLHRQLFSALDLILSAKGHG